MYVVENAGGKSSTGRQRMLDIIPEKIHSRSGIFLGSKEEVDAIEERYKNFK
jgi:fructose-1,6-bisphosphatase I